MQKQKQNQLWQQDLTAESQIQDQIELPRHVDWQGNFIPCDYLKLKATQSDLDANEVGKLLDQFVQQNLKKFSEPESKTLCLYLKNQIYAELNGDANIYGQLHRLVAKQKDNSHKIAAQCALQQFERIKTVFCHANFTTDEVQSIYNVHFDYKGKFIVSAADDGIVKVWDLNTLTLQASLHGHQDYITELDISRCNKFIVSAGKDAQIIVWELASGKIAYKFNKHTKLINCVKFFCPNTQKSDLTQQFLFSCSDDGSVRLYDFTFVNDQATQQQEIFKSQNQKVDTKNSIEDSGLDEYSGIRQKVFVSQSNPTEPAFDERNSIFQLELFPDEYRPGQKNKMLDTLAINQQGLVVAGSSSGELLIWRVNFDFINQKLNKQECVKYLGQFKMPRHQCIKLCEFCPLNGVSGHGNVLMTGSIDGVIKLWNLDVGNWDSDLQKNFNLEDKWRLLLQIDDLLGCLKTIQIGKTEIQNFTETIQEEVVDEDNPNNLRVIIVKSVVDSLKWSVNGRFALSSVSGLVQSDNSEICRVKVWDTYMQTFTEDLCRFTEVRLRKNTFVLSPHPQLEEILMTGSDEGLIVMWNIEQKQVIKQFKQYGVYSVDANIMDNPLHGNWSRDGSLFIFGNKHGTISLYANQSIAHQYQATRVQQFFDYDVTRQTDNPFERLLMKPQLCAYNMVPYEVQPERYLIRFTTIDSDFDSACFQRNQAFANELGQKEELYYKDQFALTLLANQNQNNPANQNQQGQQNQILNRNQRQNSRPQLQQNNQRLQQAILRQSSNDQQNQNSNQRQQQARNQVNVNNQNTESRDQQNSTPASINNPINQSQVQRTSNTRNSNSQMNNTLIIDTTARRNQQETKKSQKSERKKKQVIEENLSSPSLIEQGESILFEFNDGIDPDTEKLGPDYLSDNEIPQNPQIIENQKQQNSMIAASQNFNQVKAECSYQLQKSSSKKQACNLCKRENGEILGPFIKQQQDGNSSETSNQNWFHKDCLVINIYSSFDKSKKQWMNLEIMETNLIIDTSYQCFRCDGLGASVQCMSCSRNFHGFHCSKFYILPQKSPENMFDCGTNGQLWRCFFCIDNQNFQNAKLKVNDLDRRAYIDQLRLIDKAHLMNITQQPINRNLRQSNYIAQLDDIVVYFFQGHEEFLYQYNCHFFAGQSVSYPQNQVMPWLNPNQKANIWSQEFIICRVVRVKTLFPSQRSIKLMELYGNGSSDCYQSPQIIQRIQLESVLTGDKFFVDLFPNDLPDFLVLYKTYLDQKSKFEKQSLIGKEVTIKYQTKMKRVKIIEESALEPQLCKNSKWRSLVVVPTQSSEIRDKSLQQASLRVNFWDIKFDETSEQELKAFNQSDTQKLQQYLTIYTQNKNQEQVYFLTRVLERIAPDYRQIIAQEMWLDLILQRVNNQYYRSSRQLFLDIQLIASNAQAYNGLNHVVTDYANSVVKHLKAEIVKLIDCNADRQVKKRIADAIEKLLPQATKQGQVFKSEIIQQKKNNHTIRPDQEEETKQEIQILGQKRLRPTLQKKEDQSQIQAKVTRSSNISTGKKENSKNSELRKRQRNH